MLVIVYQIVKLLFGRTRRNFGTIYLISTSDLALTCVDACFIQIFYQLRGNGSLYWLFIPDFGNIKMWEFWRPSDSFFRSYNNYNCSKVWPFVGEIPDLVLEKIFRFVKFGSDSYFMFHKRCKYSKCWSVVEWSDRSHLNPRPKVDLLWPAQRRLEGPRQWPTCYVINYPKKIDCVYRW